MTNLWTVLYFTLGITLTGLMLVLFKRLFRDKLSARWHYLVWLVLLVRAILPENLRLFSTGFALNTLWISGMKRLRAAVEIGRDSLLSTPFGMGGGEISLLKKMPFSAWSLTDRLFAVYLAGVAAVLLYDALLYARLRLEIRRGAAASSSLREKIRKTAQKYDLPEQKNVRICKGIETPFLCGMVRPILVVPESMAETIDEKVLLHEMLHLKHHDVLVNFLLHLLQALNWFNPFIGCAASSATTARLFATSVHWKSCAVRKNGNTGCFCLIWRTAAVRAASGQLLWRTARGISKRASGELRISGVCQRGQPLQRRVLRWCFALLRSALPISPNISIPPRWKRRRTCG